MSSYIATIPRSAGMIFSTNSTTYTSTVPISSHGNAFSGNLNEESFPKATSDHAKNQITLWLLQTKKHLVEGRSIGEIPQDIKQRWKPVNKWFLRSGFYPTRLIANNNTTTQTFVIVGDFNSRNIFWGSSYTDNRGKIIELLESSDLILPNNGKPTEHNPINGNFSGIDLFIATSTIAPNVE